MTREVKKQIKSAELRSEPIESDNSNPLREFLEKLIKKKPNNSYHEFGEFGDSHRHSESKLMDPDV